VQPGGDGYRVVLFPPLWFRFGSRDARLAKTLKQFSERGSKKRADTWCCQCKDGVSMDLTTSSAA